MRQAGLCKAPEAKMRASAALRSAQGRLPAVVASGPYDGDLDVRCREATATLSGCRNPP
jgi:hypothetical protein